MIDVPTISIIVPVYNAEKSLDRCVQSILRQTYARWELILVDDGSKDLSGALCDDYVNSDIRIKVYHKENGGVSSARNVGLEHVKGEYVAFIDSDDYVEDDYLEKLVAYSPSDLIICGFKNIGGEDFMPVPVKEVNLSNNPITKTLIDVPYYLDTPWCKLFKTDIIKKSGLVFDKGLKLSEDTLFCYEYLCKTTTISLISDMLYVYDGKWGGGSKYKLTYDELSYMAQRITGAIKNINKVFSTDIENRYKGFHASKLINLFSDYQDEQIYHLYIKYYDKITIGDFLGDSRSPLTKGLIQAADLAHGGKRQECVELLRQIKQFTITPTFKISFCSKRIKVLCYLLQIFGPWITARVLTFLSNKK